MRLTLAWTLIFALLALAPASAATGPCPFAAHNAYPLDGQGNDKLPTALKAGLRHIEVDLTYDSQRKAAVVTHNEKPKGNEPEFGSFIKPIFAKWGKAADDGYTLILDCKLGDPQLATAINRVLLPYAGVLSKLSQGVYIAGKVSVYLSGADKTKLAFLEQFGSRGSTLAFSDRVFDDAEWKKNVADYIPKGPPGFLRYLTISLGNFNEAEPPHGVIGHTKDFFGDLGRKVGILGGHDKDSTLSEKRLSDTMRLAAKAGYIIRVYVVNAGTAGGKLDTKHWDACVRAGVPLIATDDYQAAADYWRRHK